MENKRPSLDQIFSTPAPSNRPSLDQIFGKTSAPPESDDKPGYLESAARGVAQGGSLGFADEITGALEALSDKLDDGDSSFLDNYRKHRDESRHNYDAARAANPKTFLAGELGGGAATAFVPGLGLGNGIKGAAAIGGLTGLGNSDADVTQGDLGHAALDVGKGALVGGATGAIAEHLPSFETMAQGAQNKAEELAAMSLKGNAKQYRRLGDQGIRDQGRFALDNDIVGFGTNAKSSLERASALREQAGQEMGRILDANGGTIDGAAVAQSAQSNVLDPLAAKTLDRSGINRVQGFIDELANKGNAIPLNEANQMGSSIGKIGYLDAGSKTAQRGARGVEREIDGAVRSTLQPGEALDFQRANAMFGGAKGAENLAQVGASRYAANQGVSLGDKLASIGGMAALGPKGIALGVVNKVARDRGQSAAAVTLDKISNVLRAAPQALGQFREPLAAAAQRGTSSLAAAHYVLHESNPQYRELMKGISEQ